MKPQLTLFLVENSLEDRRRYCQFLAQDDRYDYKILDFTSGRAALERCLQKLPDLILLNDPLEDLNSLWFLRHLQEKTQRQQLPVLLITEHANVQIAVEAIKHGAQDYLVKELLNCNSLCRSVHSAIERLHLTQQLEQQQEKQRLMHAITLRIHQSRDLHTLLNVSVEEIRQFLQADRVLVYQIEDNLQGQVIAESVLPEWIASLNHPYLSHCFQASCQGQYCQGGLWIAHDLDQMDLREQHRSQLEQLQVKSSLVVPIWLENREPQTSNSESLLVSSIESSIEENLTPEPDNICQGCQLRSQHLWGLLVVHQCSTLRTWQPFETELMKQLTVQLAIAIQQAELYESLQTLNQHLAVQEATNRAIIKAMPDLLVRMRKDGQYLALVSGGAVRVIRPKGEVIHYNVYDILPKSLADRRLEYTRKALETGQLQVYEQEVVFENEQRYEEVRIVVSSPEEVLTIIRDVTEQKQAEANLQKLNQELEQRVHERTAALSMANLNLQVEISQRQQIEGILRQSKDLLKRQLDAIEAAIDGIALINPAGRYTYLNQSQLKLLGYEQVEELLGEPWQKLYVPTEIQRFEQEVLPLLHQNRFWQGETIALRQDGSTFAQEVSLTLTEDGSIICVTRDITQRKQAEQALRQSEEKFRQFAENIDDVFWMIDLLPQSRLSYVSAAYEKIWGRSIEALLSDPESWPDSLHPEDWARVSTALAQNPEIQTVIDHEYRIIRPDGEVRWIRDRAFPIRDITSGKTFRIAGVAQDITARKYTELQVLQNRDLREAIFNESADAIFLVDSETLKTIDCNRRAVQLFEAPSKEALIGIEGHTLQRHQFSESEMAQIVSEISTQGFWSCEIEYVTFTGKSFWGNIAIKLIKIVDSTVNLVRVTDISDRRHAAEQIQASLQEKEVLLKEIHHRVKNNLQIISSLLKLQSRDVKDAKVLDVFQDSQNRIRSMALIHEKLYQSKDLSHINFMDYVRNLINDICRSYGFNAQRVQLTLHGTDFRLNIDVAIPCGLIINELLSNTLKYAFPKQQVGKIWIDLDQDQQQNYVLEIGDNGIGLPADFDLQSASSLGLRLVCNLVHQLDGTIDLDSNQGTIFTIKFPKSLSKTRIQSERTTGS